MINISTFEPNDTINTKFDYSIFSISNEKRSCNLFKQFIKYKPDNLGKILIFGIRELSDDKCFKEIFSKFSNSNITKSYFISSKTKSETNFFSSLLAELNSCSKTIIKILVDYSVMPRSWFCSLPMIFDAIAQKNKKLEIFFSYTPFPYHSKVYPHVYTRNLASNFMQYGNIQDFKPKLVLLGLGFDNSGADALLQRIEAEAILFYTKPPFINGMDDTITENNKQILKKYDSFTVPINNMKETYRIIENQYKIHSSKYSVSLASLGPKPMTLAASLICLNYREISDVNVDEEFLRKDESKNNNNNDINFNIFKSVFFYD